jgi:SAM-dependent methyltransferase
MVRGAGARVERTAVSRPAPNPDHPAKFSKPILDHLSALVAGEAERLKRRPTLLDPFAGVGRIHQLDKWADTTGVEIEPEWAACHSRTEVGDALGMRFAHSSFDIVATSPTYGNRMADHHTPRDGSKRYGYKFSLRRDPHPASSSTLQWGDEYRQFHVKAWREVARVLTPHGLFLLNVSNHPRGREMQPVVEWHLTHLLTVGWWLLAAIPISTQRMKNGANPERAEAEMILALRPPTAPRLF